MARTSRPRPRRLGAALAGLSIAVGAAGGAVLTIGIGGAAADPGTSTAPEVIVTCESGTVSAGGIDTSSAVAYRAPAGSPLLPGCRES